MPSFDVVSEFDAHEASNAVDQANREVSTRFDFKGTGSKYVLEEQVITLTSQSDFQLQQMLDILRQKLAKRGIDIACMKAEEPELTGTVARQKVILRQGIDTPLARDLVKKIKASKIKICKQVWQNNGKPYFYVNQWVYNVKSKSRMCHPD